MKEYNEQSADVHNGLIDAIGLLGGDVTKYSYIDPNNPDIEGRN